MGSELKELSQFEIFKDISLEHCFSLRNIYTRIETSGFYSAIVFLFINPVWMDLVLYLHFAKAKKIP
jgi:hypothetical protein